MIAFNQMNDFIGKLSQLKSEIQTMVEQYDSLPNLLEGDKRAIQRGDLADLDDLAKRKIAATDNIEGSFHKVRAMISTLVKLGKEMQLPKPRSETLTLSEAVKWLNEVAASYTSDGVASQVLAHVIKGLSQLSSRLVEAHKSIRPALEANQYLLQKMLHYRQENFRFWQEVAAASATSYNAHGEQRPAETGGSVFKISV